MARKRTTLMEELSMHHLPPDISDTEITFQLPTSVSGDNLLADDTDFFQDFNDTFMVAGTPAAHMFSKTIHRTIPTDAAPMEAAEPSPAPVQPTPGRKKRTTAAERSNTAALRRSPRKHKAPQQHQQQESLLLDELPPFPISASGSGSGQLLDHLPALSSAEAKMSPRKSSKPKSVSKSRTKTKHEVTQLIVEGELGQTPESVPDIVPNIDPHSIASLSPKGAEIATNDILPGSPKTDVGQRQHVYDNPPDGPQSPLLAEHVLPASPPSSSPNSPKFTEIEANRHGDQPRKSETVNSENATISAEPTALQLNRLSVIPRTIKSPSPPPPKVTPLTIDEVEEVNSPITPHVQPNNDLIDGEENLDRAIEPPAQGVEITTAPMHADEPMSVTEVENMNGTPPRELQEQKVASPVLATGMDTGSDVAPDVNLPSTHRASGSGKRSSPISSRESKAAERRESRKRSAVSALSPDSSSRPRAKKVRWDANVEKMPVPRSSPPPAIEPASSIQTSKKGKDLQGKEGRPIKTTVQSRARERIAARRELANSATTLAVTQGETRPAAPDASESGHDSRKAPTPSTSRVVVEVETNVVPEVEPLPTLEVTDAKEVSAQMDVDEDPAPATIVPDPVEPSQPPAPALPEVPSETQAATAAPIIPPAAKPKSTKVSGPVRVQVRKPGQGGSVDWTKSKPQVADTRQAVAKSSDSGSTFIRVHRRTNSQPGVHTKPQPQTRVRVQPTLDSPAEEDCDTHAKEADNVMRMEIDEDPQPGGEQEQASQSNQEMPRSETALRHPPAICEVQASQLESEITSTKERERVALYPRPEVEAAPTSTKPDSPIQSPKLVNAPTPTITASEPELVQSVMTSGPSSTIPASTNVPGSDVPSASTAVEAPSKTSKTLLRGRVRTSLTARKVSSGGGVSSTLTGSGAGPSRIQNKSSLKGVFSASGITRKRRSLIGSSRKSLVNRSAPKAAGPKKGTIVPRVVSDPQNATKPMEFTFNTEMRRATRKAEPRLQAENADHTDTDLPAKSIAHANDKGLSNASSSSSKHNTTQPQPAAANAGANTHMASRKGTLASSLQHNNHNYDVPDFKTIHAQNEQYLSLQKRKLGIAPVVPEPFEFQTEMRAKEREKFDYMIKEKEREMERIEEEQRKIREEEEIKEIKELRKKAVPKAHEVPEWYNERKKTVEKEKENEEVVP